MNPNPTFTTLTLTPTRTLTGGDEVPVVANHIVDEEVGDGALDVLGVVTVDGDDAGVGSVGAVLKERKGEGIVGITTQGNHLVKVGARVI